MTADGQDIPMVTPVLTTKLHVPSVGHSLVPRRRLIEHLDQRLKRRLSLVSAQAGFGKTTLLVEWVQGLLADGSSPVRVGWLSLDDGDNVLARFFAYLVAAFQQTDESVGQPGWGGAAEVAALEARTEGWIVGPQMAAFSLQGQGPDIIRRARPESIQTFAGSHRFVLDYLTSEVLDRQPPDVQGRFAPTARTSTASRGPQPVSRNRASPVARQADQAALRGLLCKPGTLT